MKLAALCLAALLAAGAARAGHPLLTEDTGVLGKDARQLEVHGARVEDEGSHTTEGATALSYGITQKTDLQVELPYVRHEGTGDPSLALKWRFYDEGPLSMIVKPVLSEAFWGSALAASYAPGDFELIGHVGYLRNRIDGERESLWHASIALLWSVGASTKVVLDLGRDTNPDPSSGASIRERVIGVAYALTADVDLGLGIKKGLSDPAEDRAWLLGAKFRW